MRAVLIKGKSFNESRKEIKKNKNKVIVFSSDKDELNRKILEKESINVFLINQSNRKDRLKQRDSGLNHVLARIAKKNNVIIGINFDEIINAKEKQRAEILARITQNIKLCNKNRVNMVFISQKYKRDIYDLKSIGLVLGMPTWMTKDLILQEV